MYNILENVKHISITFQKHQHRSHVRHNFVCCIILYVGMWYGCISSISAVIVYEQYKCLSAYMRLVYQNCRIWCQLRHGYTGQLVTVQGKIIRYSRSTINAYFLLSHKWWVIDSCKVRYKGPICCRVINQASIFSIQSFPFLSLYFPFLNSWRPS